MAPPLQRLRQRRLFQWVVAYLAGAWLLLQVLDLLAGFFEWPTVVGRVATVLLGAGFLAALVAAWYHGERGEQKVTTMEIGMLAGILVIAGAAVAFVGGGIRGGSEATTNAADPSSPAPANPSAPGAPAGAHSVAVLPFLNMSESKENEYFSDGITEEILNALVQVQGLHVPGRTSSFSFKGKDLPIPEIARRLGVAHILEGSVRKQGSRVRITAQLVDARADRHLWSQTYERELKDVFAIQEEIARAIARALEVELGGGRRPLVAASTTSTEAYDLYLLGLARLNGRRDLPQAAEYFRRAVALDSTYALAYAGLANAYAVIPFYDGGGPGFAPYLPRADSAAERAVALDSTRAEAFTARAHVRWLAWEWSKAESDFRRAIALNPNYAPAHHWYAQLLLTLRRSEEALAESRRARELDPLSPFIPMFTGMIYGRMRRYDEAITEERRSVALDPTYWTARRHLGRSLIETGRTDEGLDMLRSAGVDEEQLLVERAAREPSLRPRALANLEAEGSAGRATVVRARSYAALGEHGRALDELEAAFAERDALLPLDTTDPAFDAIRDHPRFVRLLKRMGLQ